MIVTDNPRELSRRLRQQRLPKEGTKVRLIMERMAEAPGITGPEINEIYGIEKAGSSPTKCTANLRDVYSFVIVSRPSPEDSVRRYRIVGWLNSHGEEVPIDSLKRLLEVVS